MVVRSGLIEKRTLDKHLKEARLLAVSVSEGGAF
jgi:hypothetical protein